MRFARVVLALAMAMVALTGGTHAVPAQTQPAGVQRFVIAIKNRRVDPASHDVRVRQGDSVELTFTSDEAAELHLHGYDQFLTVAPNVPATLRIDAKTAGRFSLEAHGFGRNAARGGSHVVLLYLEVHPR